MLNGQSNLKTTFRSAGCNRTPQAVSSSKTSGIVAYGARRAIAIIQPAAEKKEEIGTIDDYLIGHTDTVNCVLLVDIEDEQDVIFSGSADKQIRIWVKRKTVCVLSGHTASITALSVHQGILASGSADGTVRIWKRSSDVDWSTYTIAQEIAEPNFTPFCLSLTYLSSSLLLASGGSSAALHIYVSQDGTVDGFQHCLKLSGHEDWIRGMDTTTEESTGDTLISTASQDKAIRIWRIHKSEQQQQQDMWQNKIMEFVCNDIRYGTSQDALLIGHDDWVFSVTWRYPHPLTPTLLSASADSSVILWKPDVSSGVWLPQVRLGAMSGLKGSNTATGSVGGLWGAVCTSSGLIAAWGKTGSFRVWSEEQDTGRWVQRQSITGHTKSVTDVGWDVRGSYFLTTSKDQTTRLWTQHRGRWQEVSRPQIHGYDINSLAVLSSHTFVSGADEKVVRVFDMPRSVAIQLGDTDVSGMEDSAAVPVLGLSNKASASSIASSAINEDQLERHTLWVEKDKLIGHGYEIAVVAASHDGSVIASASRAQSPTHAVVRIHETHDWTQVAVLTVHALTVTCLAFSHDDRYLLSGSRDRAWGVIEHGDNGYRVQTVQRHHRRVVWTCAWANGAERLFATGSRDMTVRLFRETTGTTKWEQVGVVNFDATVTAVAFHPVRMIVAVGTEKGVLAILEQQSTDTWGIAQSQQPHDMAITRAAWHPFHDTLVTTSEDASVALHHN